MGGFRAAAKHPARSGSPFGAPVLLFAAMRLSTLPLLPLAVILLAAGCRPAQETPDPVEEADRTGPRLPIAEPPLDREALLIAALRAASATAVGDQSGDDQRELDGKRFEMRLRFGCGGASDAEQELRRWTFDDESRVLRVRVQPGISVDDPLIEALGGGPYEAVEGFWIRRPWVLTAGCAPEASAFPSPVEEAVEQGTSSASPAPRSTSPAKASLPSQKASPTATGLGGANGRPVADPDEGPADDAEGGMFPVAMRVGVAQFFTSTDARTHRRDSRAYENVSTIAEGEAPSTVGYDFVISGRLRRLPGGKVIACRVDKPRDPPACIISASFEKVVLMRADTGQTLANWTSG